MVQGLLVKSFLVLHKFFLSSLMEMKLLVKMTVEIVQSLLQQIGLFQCLGYGTRVLRSNTQTSGRRWNSFSEISIFHNSCSCSPNIFAVLSYSAAQFLPFYLVVLD